MRNSSRCVSRSILLLLIVTNLLRGQERVTVAWADLATALQGRQIRTVLSDGTELRGRALEVSDAGMRFQANRVSGSAAYRKGVLTLTPDQLTVLSYKQTSGPRRLIGTAIGVGAGAALGAVGAVRFNNEGNSAAAGTVFAVATGAGAAIGYLAGRAADNQEVIVVVTEKPASP